jgi:hypothetical protein
METQIGGTPYLTSNSERRHELRTCPHDGLNKFLQYLQANMIYLGKLTNRVPIVPPFAPSHHICD